MGDQRLQVVAASQCKRADKGPKRQQMAKTPTNGQNAYQLLRKGGSKDKNNMFSYMMALPLVKKTKM